MGQTTTLADKKKPELNHEKVVYLNQVLYDFNTKAGILRISMSSKNVKTLIKSLEGKIDTISLPIRGDNERLIITDIKEIHSFHSSNYAFTLEENKPPCRLEGEPEYTIELNYL
jgi:hypothetical protein